MAKLAEIKNASYERGEPRTIYVNPINVTFVEPLGSGGTRIGLNSGNHVQTTVAIGDVLGAINQAML